MEESPIDDDCVRVLLVEDSAEDARLVEEYLSEAGGSFDLVRAQSLEGGLERIREGAPDVILLDLNLPESRGMETFRTVREAVPSVPIVVMTAVSDLDVARKTLEAGGQDYLVKERADDYVLSRALRYAIQRKRHERELEDTIDELERANELLEERSKELRRSNEELEDFAYVVSHDLREPIRMVRSYLQLLEEHYSDALDEDAEEFIDYAVDGAARMDSMLRGLLDLSRVDRRGDEPVPVDSGEALEAALENLEVAIRERGAEIEHGELPVVEADESQLVQLFQNLIGNAIRFSEGPPHVEVAAEAKDGTWRFTVTDDGIGVAPEHQERIFQVFQRLHTHDEIAGDGIGLAICRKIVERHGGEIGVESAVGEGSTFWFTLPAADAPS